MKPGRFYSGLFVLTFSTLALEIIQTRLLSVVTWYHLAFFVISSAMFGMTAGAVWIYVRRARFTPASSHDLSWLSGAFAVSSALSLAAQVTLAPALGLLQSRHLVLFASLREQILSRALAARADTFDRALTHAATADYLARRELAFRRLERGGAVCLDVEPAELPISLVNRYIDIKRSGRL